MPIDIYQDFQESVNQIKELMQIDATQNDITKNENIGKINENKKRRIR